MAVFILFFLLHIIIIIIMIMIMIMIMIIIIIMLLLLLLLLLLLFCDSLQFFVFLGLLSHVSATSRSLETQHIPQDMSSTKDG